MSEDDQEFTEESKKKELKVTIQSEDPDAQKLKQQLEEEKSKRADVEAHLEIIAEKEFVKAKANLIAKAKTVGITIDPEDIPNDEPEKLSAYAKIVTQKIQQEKANEEEYRKTHAPAGGTPITGKEMGDSQQGRDQSGTPIEERTYENLEEMMGDLENERKAGNRDAEKALSKLTKKALKKDFEAEFQGNLPEAYSLSNQKAKDPKTQKEIDEKAKKERQKWKEVD
jgi:hypothetical protein